MATYADWKDLVNRYSAMSKIGDAGEINSNHIHPAEREIESALGAYYTTPFSSNNSTVKDLTIELTYIRYYENHKPAWAEKKIEHFEKRIGKLIAGTMTMMTDAGESITMSSGPGGALASTTQNYPPTFGVGAIEDMAVSSDQLLAEEDARE